MIEALQAGAQRKGAPGAEARGSAAPRRRHTRIRGTGRALLAARLQHAGALERNKNADLIGEDEQLSPVKRTRDEQRMERGRLRAAGGAPSGSIRGRGGDPASGGHVSPLLGAWGPVSGRGSQLRGTGGALAVCGRTAEAAPCGSSGTEPLVRQVCPLGSCSARAPWSERCWQPGRAPRHPGLRGDR